MDLPNSCYSKGFFKGDFLKKLWLCLHNGIFNSFGCGHENIM